ncbi:T9SS type A sorting domain-containing protein [Psychroserpens damuponensis]|uniref:T9SS type A sorting domain-containing protein n=1 Tax=Psychroserpens damuponensis TaxID=943936 RepID=UPI00059028B3|nr:T9SS type A sorting domain-containing protein [Psychroserpens damuponensis]
MQKNYLFTYLFILTGFLVSAQTVIYDQPIAGTNGIVTGNYATDGVSVYSADDFNLDNTYNIEVITAFGFQNDGDLETIITGLDVFIYTDAAGVPSSDPTSTGTGLLEIINLDPASPALTIINDGLGGFAFEIDVAAASGSSLTLTAGTYWLVVAPYVPSIDGTSRWNWYSATDGTLSEAHLIDPSDLFGAGATSWTQLTALGLTFSSTAFTIEGSTLSVDEFALETVSLFPNPAKNTLHLDMPASIGDFNTEIFSVLGQSVSRNTNSSQLDISNLNTGMYLLKISTDNGTITKRFTKN